MVTEGQVARPERARENWQYLQGLYDETFGYRELAEWVRDCHRAQQELPAPDGRYWKGEVMGQLLTVLEWAEESGQPPSRQVAKNLLGMSPEEVDEALTFAEASAEN